VAAASARVRGEQSSAVEALGAEVTGGFDGHVSRAACSPVQGSLQDFPATQGRASAVACPLSRHVSHVEVTFVFLLLVFHMSCSTGRSSQ